MILIMASFRTFSYYDLDDNREVILDNKIRIISNINNTLAFYIKFEI